ASLADYRAQSAWFTAMLPAWQAHGITVLDPARVLVAGERTQIAVGGVPLYFDSHHLSLAGARALIAAAP
ncbi:MAG TPA: SGNH hydrolase domain-containing protein, partial [Novosphingobium sp.]|nr:SGNH hydrolase domain-containing protein [Novosphingobium sp.]